MPLNAWSATLGTRLAHGGVGPTCGIAGTVLWIGLLFSGLTACVEDQQADIEPIGENSTLSGRVVAISSGEPIVGLVAAVGERTTVTSASGEYTLQAALETDHQVDLEVERGRFISKVSCGREADFEVYPKGRRQTTGNVQVSIRGVPDGAVLLGHITFASGSGWSMRDPAFTAASSGRATLSVGGMPTEAWDLIVTASVDGRLVSYSRLSEQQAPAEGVSELVETELRQDGLGMVRWDGRTPAETARVSLLQRVDLGTEEGRVPLFSGTPPSGPIQLRTLPGNLDSKLFAIVELTGTALCSRPTQTSAALRRSGGELSLPRLIPVPTIGAEGGQGWGPRPDLVWSAATIETSVITAGLFFGNTWEPTGLLWNVIVEANCSTSARFPHRAPSLSPGLEAHAFVAVSDSRGGARCNMKVELPDERN
jgi:hypothetical protein